MMKNAPSWWSIHYPVYRYQEREPFFVIYIQGSREPTTKIQRSCRLTLSLCPKSNPYKAYRLSRWYQIKDMSKNQIVSIVRNGNTLFGVISNNGQQIISCDYSSVMGIVCNGRDFYIVEKQYKFGLNGEDGRVILSCMYDSIFILSQSFPQYLKVKRNGLYGVYNIIKEDFERDCEAKEITLTGDILSIRYSKTFLWGLVKLSSAKKVKLPF